MSNDGSGFVGGGTLAVLFCLTNAIATVRVRKTKPSSHAFLFWFALELIVLILARSVVAVKHIRMNLRAES